MAIKSLFLIFSVSSCKFHLSFYIQLPDLLQEYMRMTDGVKLIDIKTTRISFFATVKPVVQHRNPIVLAGNQLAYFLRHFPTYYWEMADGMRGQSQSQEILCFFVDFELRRSYLFRSI
jgi:hypothetical protein